MLVRPRHLWYTEPLHSGSRPFSNTFHRTIPTHTKREVHFQISKVKHIIHERVLTLPVFRSDPPTKDVVQHFFRQ